MLIQVSWLPQLDGLIAATAAATMFHSGELVNSIDFRKALSKQKQWFCGNTVSTMHVLRVRFLT